MPTLQPKPFRRAALALFAVLLLGLAAWAGRQSAAASANPDRGATPAAAPSLLPAYGLRAVVPDVSSAGINDVAYAPQRDRLFVAFSIGPYLGAGKTLSIVDTRRGALLDTFEGPDVTALALSRDGARLYAYSRVANTVTRYDTATLGITGEYLVPCPTGFAMCEVTQMVMGPGERLYWFGDPDNILMVVDALTGQRLAEVEFEEPATLAALAAAGDDLFLAEYGWGNPEPKLRRYDVSQPNPALELAVPQPSAIYTLLAAPDGSYLLALNNGPLLQLDAANLTEIRTLMNESGEHVATAAIALDSRSFTGLWSFSYRRGLRTLDAATAEVFRGQTFIDDNPFGPLVALKDGHLALLIGGDVHLYFPTDYTAGIPVALAGHCGLSPWRDDFSDPASGWPIGDTGATVFGYDEGHYSILQRAANRWSAVSRGDRWENADDVRVVTWPAGGDGFSGLVFGLNDDWSHFYTFEVYSHLSRWAVFEYTQGQWRLLRTSVGGQVNPPGLPNLLRLMRLDANTVRLAINDFQVYDVDNVAGRVGLSAGSLEPAAEARFDDYMFVGNGCLVPEARTRPDRAPIISRPPLETLLSDK